MLKALSIASLLFTSLAQANDLGKTYEYSGNGKKFVGYLVKAAGESHVSEAKASADKTKEVKSESKPAILLVHNWMGVTAETKKQADRFAKLGYTVFAVDVYGQGKNPKDVKEASKTADQFKKDRKLLRENLNIALADLIKQENVDAKKIVAMGYCFGGTAALELARSGADLLGVISFHGGLDSPTPADGRNIKAKVLALHGAIDPFVKVGDLIAFENEMNNSKIDYQLISYGNTVHSFTEVAAGTDNSKGAAYNEKSDQRSFIAAENFLSELSK